MEEAKKMNFNISNYKKWKDAGSITMQKIGKSVMLVKAMWDPETGLETDPQYVSLTPKTIVESIVGIESNIKKLEDDLTILNELNADVRKLLED